MNSKVFVCQCCWCGRLNKISSFSAHGKIGNFIIIFMLLKQLKLAKYVIGSFDFLNVSIFILS